LLKIFTF
ncbi:glutamate decarboxylase, partial [Escherichia coli 95.0183]